MSDNVILAQQTIEGFAEVEEGAGVYSAQREQALSLTDGETYTVAWDGTEYSCIAVSMDGAMALGNLSLAGISSLDSGEPFVIGCIPAVLTGGADMLMIYTIDAAESHTVAIAVEGIVTFNRYGDKEYHYGIQTLTLDTTTEKHQRVHTKGVKTEKSVALDMADGDLIIEPDPGTLLGKVTVQKPETAISENIRNGVEIGGVKGNFLGDTEEITVDLNMADGDQVIVPSADGKVISKVTVKKPETMIPENIPEDVDIGGVIGTLEVGTGTGGGGDENSGYHVEVIDYDGTVLAEAYLNEGDVFSLPPAPTHDRLVFEGWSSPVEICNNAVTVEDHDIIVGAVYHTASGATEFDICLNTATGLSITFDDVLTGMTSIDWGDGSDDSTLTHTYAEYGEYTIKIYGMTAIAVSSNNSNITDVASDYRIQRVFLSKNVTSIGDYAFNGCRGITTFVIPNGITEIKKYTLAYLYALKAIVIPNSVTTLRNYTLAYCYALKSVVIPNSVTIFYTYVLSSCYGIESIVLPDSLTGWQDYSLYNCPNLKRVNLPKNIGSIAINALSSCSSLTTMVIPASCTLLWSSAFSSCHGMRVYDFSKHTTVPTGSSNMFSNIHGMCKILVPSSLYETWKAETYWLKIAGNLVPT